MRKISLWFIVLFCFGFISVFAEEVNVSVEVNENEVENLLMPGEALSLTTSIGKEVRKIMLLRDASKILFQAQVIYNNLNDDNISDYLVELQELKSEIENLQIDDNFSVNYVAYKKELLDLFHELRSYLVSLNLTPEIKQKIRDEIHNTMFKNEELNQYKEQIRNLVRQYNEYRLQEIKNRLQLRLNITPEELQNKTRLRERLKQHLMQEVRKAKALNEIKERVQEMKSKQEIMKREIKERAKAKISQVIAKHFNKRLERMKQNHPQLFKRILNKIQQKRGIRIHAQGMSENIYKARNTTNQGNPGIGPSNAGKGPNK